MARTESVAFRAGYGILPLLSQQQYKRSTGPLVELVKNSLDAGADHIHVDFLTATGRGRPTIVVDDDGIGMDGKGINLFYTIADSWKKEAKFNSKHRPIIGRYGIGNIGLYALGAVHELETVKGETVRTVSVNFDALREQGVNWLDYQHSIEAHEDARRNPGTRITISELRENYGKAHFGTIKTALKKALGRELSWHLRYPIEIRVNGERVKSYMDEILRNVEPTEIEFSVKVREKTEKVKGRIWLLEQALEPQNSGVFPIINGANPVTDGHLYAQFMPMPRGWGALRDRVYGEINADFLVDKLDLTRDGFINVDNDDLLIAYHQALSHELIRILDIDTKQRRTRETKEEKELVAGWVQRTSALFRNERTDIVGKIDQVNPSEHGRTEGEIAEPRKRRIWVKPSEKDDEKIEKKERQPRLREHDTGTLTARLGGVNVHIRTVEGEGPNRELVGVSAGEYAEILVYKGHPLYSQAEQHGANALNDLVEPQIIEAAAAYRLNLDGITDHETVRTLTASKLHELGLLRQK